MILFVSGAHTAVLRYGSMGHLGWLLTPRAGASLETVIASGLPFAADNDCYIRLDRAAYLHMLKRLASARDLSRLRFVTVPDVVADSATTLDRWRLWLPILRYYGLPPAFVAQDGQVLNAVPWQEVAALFIGGTTHFKEVEAAPLIREAKARGLWVHAGRVNTLRRMRLMDALGCDSFDGSIFSKMSDKYVPWMLRGLDHHQHGMPEVFYG